MWNFSRVFHSRQENSSNEQNRIIPFHPANTTTNTNAATNFALSTGDMMCDTIMTTTKLDNQRHRAKATNNQYDPRVVEFKQWCDQYFENDTLETRYTVTEAKLVSFLRMEVIGRMSKKNQNEEIGESSIKAYKNAIVDLYKQQRSQNVNSNPHPGDGKTLKELLKSVKRDRTARMKRNYQDRGKHDYRMKSFTKEQLHKITDFHMNETKKLHNSLRDEMSEFNMRAMSLRGEHMRMLEFPDIFVDNIEGQGVGECKAMIFVLNKGKTDQYGKQQFSATLRHRDVLQCPQSKLGLYLLHRFDMSREGLPNFEDPSLWYDLKLYRRASLREKMQEVAYNTHLNSVKTTYRACRFKVHKQTHLMRGDSIRHAEAVGLDREKRNPMGRWGMGSMDNCYARSLPIDGMRVMAGFHPDVKNYRIFRDDIDPPDSLKKMIFPGVEFLFEEEEAKSEKDINFAKLQFLEMLLYLRKVILQDSCRLQSIYPDHKNFSHEVFSHSDYKEFKESVLKASENEFDEEKTLEERMPSVVVSLNQKINELIEADRVKTKQIEAMKQYVGRKVKSIKKILKAANIEISFEKKKKSRSPNQRVTRSRAAKKTYELCR